MAGFGERRRSMWSVATFGLHCPLSIVERGDAECIAIVNRWGCFHFHRGRGVGSASGCWASCFDIRKAYLTRPSIILAVPHFA